MERRPRQERQRHKPCRRCRAQEGCQLELWTEERQSEPERHCDVFCVGKGFDRARQDGQEAARTRTPRRVEGAKGQWRERFGEERDGKEDLDFGSSTSPERSIVLVFGYTPSNCKYPVLTATVVRHSPLLSEGNDFRRKISSEGKVRSPQKTWRSYSFRRADSETGRRLCYRPVSRVHGCPVAICPPRREHRARCRFQGAKSGNEWTESEGQLYRSLSSQICAKVRT